MFSRGIVHRDLRLENIMLHKADPNAVKVIDFGLAMELEVSLASLTRHLIPLISLPAPSPLVVLSTP
jgi:serine/threonine protein kinase